MIASRPGRRPGRTAAIVSGVLVFAVLAGVLLAQFSGQRGSGTLTGNDPTLRQQLADCQSTSAEDPGAGADCYAAILEEHPGQRGSPHLPGVGASSATSASRRAAPRRREPSRSIPTPPTPGAFRAVVATRAGDYATAAAEIDRFYRNDPSQVAVRCPRAAGPRTNDLLRIRERARPRECWQDAAKQSSSESGIDQAFLDSLGACLTACSRPGRTTSTPASPTRLSALGPDRDRSRCRGRRHRPDPRRRSRRTRTRCCSACRWPWATTASTTLPRT